MSQQTINVGASANDGTGDSIRAAFIKCNDNFTELYTASSSLTDDLNVAGYSIVSVSNGDINIVPSGTGSLRLGNLKVTGGTNIGTVTASSNIGLVTSGTGVTTINAINATGGNINNVTIGATTPQQGTFTNVFSQDHRAVADDLYRLGTSAIKWKEVNTVTVNGNLIVLKNASSIGTAGSIDVTKSYTKLNSAAGLFTATLPDGTDGQLMTLVMNLDGGDITVTPDHALGFSSLVFKAAGDTANLLYSATAFPLSGVAIAGTAGQFTCTATAFTLKTGFPVTVSGTLTGSGTISGYTSSTTYYIIATNGSTTFTLSATLGGSAITTTAGTTTGLTFTSTAGNWVVLSSNLTP